LHHVGIHDIYPEPGVIFILDFHLPEYYSGLRKEVAMLYAIAPLFTIIILFAMCEEGERSMESKRDFWLRNQHALDKMRWGWSY
jgi:hypothetical protein